MHKFAGLLLLTAGLSSASTITYVTSKGTESGGNAISASAAFTTTAGQLTIVLKNLESGITSFKQTISDLEFVSSTRLGNSTAMISWGQDLTCSGHSCTTGFIESTGWGFGSVGGESIICIVCGNANMLIDESEHLNQTIIGPSPVANNALDNHSLNPYVNQTATFTIWNSSITANTTISNVIFSFGSTAGDDVTGCAVGINCTSSPNSPAQAPEPMSAFLIGGGLLGVGILGKFRRAPRA